MTDNDWIDDLIDDLDGRTARKRRTIKKQSGKEETMTKNRQVAAAIKLPEGWRTASFLDIFQFILRNIKTRFFMPVIEKFDVN